MNTKSRDGFPHTWETWNAISISSAIMARVRTRFNARIHSIFKRSLNCRCVDDTLITVSSRGLGNGPFSIVVDIPLGVQLDSSRLENGMLVQTKGSSLCFPDIKLHVTLDNAEIWTARRKLNQPLLPEPRIKSNIECCDSVARTSGFVVGLGRLLWHREELLRDNLRDDGDLNSLCRVALRPLSKLIQGIKAQNIPQIDASTKRLIGLGVGLTPSADDILVGLMGGLILVGDHLEQPEYVSAVAGRISRLAVGRTTLISQNYLRHAARGELHEKLSDIICSILTSSRDKVTSATLTALSIGSTSGTEMVLGALLGLEICLDLFKPKSSDWISPTLPSKRR